MKDNSLLASVALFSELYNSKKYSNISDIIAEFIKGAVISERKWAITSTELTELLYRVYNFRIPESVVRTTVKSRLRKCVKVQGSFYHFELATTDGVDKMHEDYENISSVQNNIIEGLISFIQSKFKSALDEREKERIIEDFKKYLLDNGIQEEYSKYISAYVLKNQENVSFTENLNLIREGLILYQGIRFTADINELGKWNTALNVFLSTEHLFNAVGFNGHLFKQIFDDFYKLQNEINASNKNKNSDKRITLRYFEETKHDIDNFFHTAEQIKRGQAILDPTKPAMIEILKGCRNPSDIQFKKVKFFTDLKQMGINLYEFQNSIYEHIEYNVEDQSVIDILKEKSEQNNKPFDEEECRRLFRIFSKVNYLRGGQSNTNFENIGHVYITGNRFALFLAHNTKVKFNDDDIPFAKDIDFVTNKFWFKLKKGLGDRENLPRSFDVVTKAQIVLSSQISQTVYSEYKNLQKQLLDGALTREEALERSYVLREKPTKPEDITVEALDNSLDFLNSNSYYDDYYREKEMREMAYEESQREIEMLRSELEIRDRKEEEQRLKDQREQYLIERDNYISMNIAEDYKSNMNDFWYFSRVMVLTYLPIFLVFTLKANKDLNEWMESIGNYQYLVYGLLCLITFSELVGRSYFFNKDKVKNGYEWFMILLNRSRRSEYKFVKSIQFKAEYDARNISMDLSLAEESI